MASHGVDDLIVRSVRNYNNAIIEDEKEKKSFFFFGGSGSGSSKTKSDAAAQLIELPASLGSPAPKTFSEWASSRFSKADDVGNASSNAVVVVSDNAGITNGNLSTDDVQKLITGDLHVSGTHAGSAALSEVKKDCI